jgi:hypothetical protein
LISFLYVYVRINEKEDGIILTLPGNLGTTSEANPGLLVVSLLNDDLVMNGIPGQCFVPLLD